MNGLSRCPGNLPTTSHINTLNTSQGVLWAGHASCQQTMNKITQINGNCLIKLAQKQRAGETGQLSYQMEGTAWTQLP